MFKINNLKHKRTKLKRVLTYEIGKRLFTDFGGICFYKIIKVYKWKEYCRYAVSPNRSHWFEHKMAKIKTETGVVMKVPYEELVLQSVYADTGERVRS